MCACIRACVRVCMVLKYIWIFGKKLSLTSNLCFEFPILLFWTWCGNSGICCGWLLTWTKEKHRADPWNFNCNHLWCYCIHNITWAISVKETNCVVSFVFGNFHFWVVSMAVYMYAGMKLFNYLHICNITNSLLMFEFGIFRKFFNSAIINFFIFANF